MWRPEREGAKGSTFPFGLASGARLVDVQCPPVEHDVWDGLQAGVFANAAELAAVGGIRDRGRVLPSSTRSFAGIRERTSHHGTSLGEPIVSVDCLLDAGGTLVGVHWHRITRACFVPLPAACFEL